MSLEANKEIAHRMYDVFNKHNPALLDEIIAPDYIDHTLQLRGLDQWKQTLTLLLKGFPDIHPIIESILAEDDKVQVHVKVTGTQTGEYRGFPPTGKKMMFRYSSIWRIMNGKVAERETIYDLMDSYKQLGVIAYKGFLDEKVS